MVSAFLREARSSFFAESPSLAMARAEAVLVSREVDADVREDQEGHLALLPGDPVDRCRRAVKRYAR
jgi:hypothetical protein